MEKYIKILETKDRHVKNMLITLKNEGWAIYKTIEFEHYRDGYQKLYHLKRSFI